jgi:hypothetical protein
MGSSPIALTREIKDLGEKDTVEIEAVSRLCPERRCSFTPGRRLRDAAETISYTGVTFVNLIVADITRDQRLRQKGHSRN